MRQKGGRGIANTPKQLLVLQNVSKSFFGVSAQSKADFQLLQNEKELLRRWQA